MAEFTIENTPINDTSRGEVLKNVKEMSIGDGKVRIKDGALIISDETGTDRVLIKYLEEGF